MTCKFPKKCWCASCRKRYDAARYKYRTSEHKDYVMTRTESLRQFIRDLKTDKPCTDCGGVFHWAAMQFDHIGSDKTIEVSKMSAYGYSKESILEEVAKCEIVCANCHSIRTHLRRIDSVGRVSNCADAQNDTNTLKP